MQERSLATEVQFLKGVGPRGAVSLGKAGIKTVGDLLFRLPRRYEDRRNLPPIAELRPGEYATVRGRIVKVEARPISGGRVILKAVVRDRTGSVALTWFNQPWVRRALEEHEGDILAYGVVKDSSGYYEIASPEWETISEDDDADDFARIVPVYSLTEGLAQKLVRRAVKSAIEGYVGLVVDPLPERILRDQKLPGLEWSIKQIHSPESETHRVKARSRLVFDEFFILQVALAMRRAQTQQELGISFPIEQLIRGGAVAQVSALEAAKANIRRQTGRSKASTPSLEHDASLFEAEARDKRNAMPLWDQVHAMLPFELTGAQNRVVGEIWADMARPHPMNRLVQGDVGSGKTAVAACAILAAIRSGYQAAMMAPTEILAEQHYNGIKRILEPLGVEVGLLIGKQGSRDRKREMERTATGANHLVIGTHAIIQDSIQFKSLGLAIVDEQHRFGVMQRKALRDKSFGNPDVLVMTATPIPRTLTMTTYGDLDVSVIDELPPGRKPIKTHWRQPYERDKIYNTVRRLIEEGRQAYFVCPMVSENEKLTAQAAEDLHYRLQNEVYADLKVGLLHGQMKPKEKEEAMDLFRTGQTQILVSTTVIEVGVDVPNASVMVIEDANRFGLSQLHQLRGRVGRGQFQSFCILIAEAKSDEARARMDIMVATNDGFKIAEEDLRLRGPGELAGTQQAGNADFKIADLIQDAKMLEVARQAALAEFKTNPSFAGNEWSRLHERVRESHGDLAIVSIS